ncbi:MAG TPA: hypothetical protein VK154_10655 [Chitinophagales bacterium]|nr:hypothetical protein [Chitinophagales bacterium]
METKFTPALRSFSFAAFVVLLCAIMVACNQKTEKQEATEQPVAQAAEVAVVYPKDSFEQGKIYNQVPLAGNGAESFALYLPKNYDKAVKYPAIIFLDIYGQGALPLQMYSALADKHGYILAGSNNFSKKFTTPEATAVANRLVKEISERFSVDEKRLTLCGYGNGAKGAIETAYNNSAVTQVVYIGATADLAPANHPVDMLGFAGTKDLNYSNVVLFSAQTMPANLHTQLVEWPGKQEWVPAAYFEPAFIYPFSTIEKGKLIAVDEKKKGDLKTESVLRAELKESMKAKDLGWWKIQIAEMKKKQKENPMMERLLGYVSLGCYSYCNSAIQQNNVQILDKIIPIYEMVEPGNEDLVKFKEAYKKMKGV